MDTPQLLSIKPVRHWGGSYVVTLVKEVRSALKLKAGDTVAFRKVGRYVFIGVVNAAAVAPITKEELELARSLVRE